MWVTVGSWLGLGAQTSHWPGPARNITSSTFSPASQSGSVAEKEIHLVIPCKTLDRTKKKNEHIWISFHIIICVWLRIIARAYCAEQCSANHKIFSPNYNKQIRNQDSSRSKTVHYANMIVIHFWIDEWQVTLVTW